MSHRIDIRLPDCLYKQLRKHDGSMTQNVCTALTQYLGAITTAGTADAQYLQHLEHEVEYLRGITSSVMNRVTLLPEHAQGPEIVDIPMGHMPQSKHKGILSRLFRNVRK